MASNKVEPGTHIKAGQWVCKQSNLRYGITASPREVIKTSGQRVYVKNRHGEDDGDWMLQKAIAFVSDTREEADAIHAISEAQYSCIKASLKAIEAEHGAKIAALLNPANIIAKDDK